MCSSDLNKKAGFTLIELMIVVAIIGILAAIAIPNFIRYQLRSKTTEAKTVIGGIKTSEEAFRAEYDDYCSAPATGNVGLLTTKAPWGGAACAAACARPNIVASCVEFSCMGYLPSGEVYYSYDTGIVAAAAAQPAEFKTGAIADLDGDGTNAGFAYGTGNGTGGVLSAAVSGQVEAELNGCLSGTGPAGEVIDCTPNVY